MEVFNKGDVEVAELALETDEDVWFGGFWVVDFGFVAEVVEVSCCDEAVTAYIYWLIGD